MRKTDLKIGLSFSGGGFRASSFSLGVLSYLNSVKIGDEQLLEKVVALSTISGGTITGARYAIGIKNGENFKEIYEALYRFMSEVDIINLSLSKLISKKDWDGNRMNSLICAFADVYNDELFNQEKFGTLLSEESPIHLKHISFNATEFANALQFRFQKTENGNAAGDQIGNFYYRIPESIAKDMRMGDIMAASSCFPGGFEPINFPDDFNLPKSEESDTFFKDEIYPIGLMDGGIVDNQGIEPLLLAEDKMKRKRTKKEDESNDSRVLDLLIISDVTSPYMEDYKSNQQPKENFWRKLTPRSILTINAIVLLLLTVTLVYSIINEKVILGYAMSSLVTISLIVFFLLRFIKALPLKFEVPKAFLAPLKKLLMLRLVIYENMLMNRTNSLLKMTNDVFLKHIRRLNFNTIFKDNSWRNRRLMNAVYQLRDHDQELVNRKINKGTIKEELIPSKAIQAVATKAASMGTTLWFTKEELEEKNMLNTLIACGQFTMCWNLLMYIDEIKKKTDNTNENHQALINCEGELLKHWELFKLDPFWMLKN